MTLSIGCHPCRGVWRSSFSTTHSRLTGHCGDSAISRALAVILFLLEQTLEYPLCNQFVSPITEMVGVEEYLRARRQPVEYIR